MNVQFLVSLRVLNLCADLNLSTQDVDDLVDGLLIVAEWPALGPQTRLSLFRLARFFISLEFRRDLPSTTFEEMKVIEFDFPEPNHAVWPRVTANPEAYGDLFVTALGHCRVVAAAWPATGTHTPLFQWLQDSQLRLTDALEHLRQLRLMEPEMC